jgi:hypothetical protein
MTEDINLDDIVAIWRIKAYTYITKSGKNVSQINSQGNWMEQFGVEIGSSISDECYQNRLIILED